MSRFGTPNPFGKRADVCVTDGNDEVLVVDGEHWEDAHHEWVARAQALMRKEPCVGCEGQGLLERTNPYQICAMCMGHGVSEKTRKAVLERVRLRAVTEDGVLYEWHPQRGWIGHDPVQTRIEQMAHDPMANASSVGAWSGGHRLERARRRCPSLPEDLCTV